MNGRAVDVVAPSGLDDPRRPSGGNTYDRRVCAALAGAGWSVRLRTVPGEWPQADEDSRQCLARLLDALPERALVLVDGLVGLAAPEVLVPASRRLRTVLLLHSPLGGVDDARAGERAVLRAVTAVVATSGWTRRWLLEEHGLDPVTVHVAAPGVDPAPPSPGTRGGGRLLCVGAVTPVKGHDVLVAALAGVADLAWGCACVGALDRAPGFADDVRRDLRRAGLGGRVAFTGPQTGPALAASYAAADVLVLPSRAETYGMVVTEALACGLPVLASDVGGVPEALGTDAGGRRPGLLTSPGDAEALAGSLRRWLADAGLRHELRCAARDRRTALSGWADTADRVSRVLEGVAA